MFNKYNLTQINPLILHSCFFCEEGELKLVDLGVVLVYGQRGKLVGKARVILWLKLNQKPSVKLGLDYSVEISS